LVETIPKTRKHHSYRPQRKGQWTKLPLFEIPRSWLNETIYIIGGGPSVSNTPLHLIYDKKIIGVNMAYKLGDWIDICFFGDSRWFDWNREEIKKFKGTIITCQRKLRHINGHDIKSVQKGKKKGIETNPKFVCWNGSSGGCAINIAYHLGASRIVLIGFDMKTKNGEHHFHNDYPAKGKQYDPYKKFIEPFPVIKKEANRLGVEILNATPDSTIDCFPIVKIEDTL
jgi:hypothetical protein